MDDLIIFLIYVLIIVGGMVASALQAKKKRQQKSTADIFKESDQSKEYDELPDAGPFAEFFDQQAKEKESPLHESIEYGPTVEEGGYSIEKSDSYEGMTKSMESISKIPEMKIDRVPESRITEKTDVQKWIEKYNALQKDIEGDYAMDEISKGEIVSEEAAAEKASAVSEQEPFLDMRKAIIYSEILKRKEF
ncbi:MAG: hypothetical protein JXA61_04835 [Bacteroidales bacterium]|nr:hypothetical protein [Bacteroidales bacterium]